MDEPLRTLEETSDIDLLHDIGSRMAAADPFHEVLQRVLDMVTAAVRCDSCFIYVLEKDKLVLRASKNPHEDVVDRMQIDMGQGVTGWVAEQKQTVALPAKAWADPRCRRTALRRSLLCPSCAAASWLAPLTCSTASRTTTRSARSS